MKNRVMIVDDSGFMRNALKAIFEKNGYIIVAECENGVEAVDKYIEFKPDLVTMDIMMPILDGIQATKKIIEIHENANIVMISSMGQDSKIKESILAGAKEFIIKPFTEEVILSVCN